MPKFIELVPFPSSLPGTHFTQIRHLLTLEAQRKRPPPQTGLAREMGLLLRPALRFCLPAVTAEVLPPCVYLLTPPSSLSGCLTGASTHPKPAALHAVLCHPPLDASFLSHPYGPIGQSKSLGKVSSQSTQGQVPAPGMCLPRDVDSETCGPIRGRSCNDL